ncbi:MAG: hypothetical protein V1753_09520 [Pseudomonadota bacterium]
MKRQKEQYLVELDGARYLCAGAELSIVSGLADVQGDVRFVSDFGQSVAGLKTVESSLKYADMMLRKKLQDSGEFEGQLSIIAHEKRKVGPLSTELFFTAVPGNIFVKYSEGIAKAQGIALFWPLYLVLHNLAKKLSLTGGVAVAFQHDRFIDIVVAAKQKAVYVNRLMAYDSSDDQISQLWADLDSNLNAVETEKGVKVVNVYLITWINSSLVPKSILEHGKREYVLFDEESVTINEKERNVSLLNAVRMAPASSSLSPAVDKLAHYAGRSFLALNILLVLLVLFCIAGHTWCDRKAAMVKGEIAKANSQAAILNTGEADMAGRSGIYEKGIDLARDLDYSRRAPSCVDIFADISTGLSEKIVIDGFRASYGDKAVDIDMVLSMEDPFDLAYPGYRAYMDGLKSKGYSAAESKFETSLNKSKAILKITREIK